MERITSRKNPAVEHTVRLCRDRAFRRSEGQFVCDGFLLYREAVLCGAAVKAVFVADGCGMEGGTDFPREARVFSVPGGLMEHISPSKSPQGIVCVCTAPALRPPENLAGGRYIALDRMSDAGNVGTLIRSARAFSLDGMFLLGNCADPLNPKAVRASMGAVFTVPIYETDADEMSALLLEVGIPLFASMAGGKTVTELDLSRSCVVIGAEASGISSGVLSLCGGKVGIPMPPESESLNAAVAGSIIMWEMARTEK